MRYLRVLTNSAIAGALMAGYLLITTLHLNPEFPLGVAEVVPLAIALGLAYGANALVAFYALIVLRQVAAVQVLSPGWLSVRVLAWTSTIAAGAGATVLWLNAIDFGPFVSAETARRMTLAAIAVAICGGVCLGVALAHIGRRGTAPSGVLLVTTMASSLLVPLLLRGPARAGPEVADSRPPAAVGGAVPDGRVVLVAVDGASLDHISLAVAEGRLPELRSRARYRRRHAPGHPQAHTGRAGVDHGGHRPAAADERRAIGGALPGPRRRSGARRAARLHVRAGPGALRIPARRAPRP